MGANVTAGNLIVVLSLTQVQQDTPPTIPQLTTVSDGSVSLTRAGADQTGELIVGTVDGPPLGQTVSIWYYIAPTTGPWTLHLTYGNLDSGQQAQGNVYEFTRVASSSPLHGFSSRVNGITSNSVNPISSGLVTADTAELIVAIMGGTSTSALTYATTPPFTSDIETASLFAQYLTNAPGNLASTGNITTPPLFGSSNTMPSAAASFKHA